jgi:hypothetical protein
MAQQVKPMRVSARKGFAYHSVKLALMAKCNSYEVDSNAFSQSVEGFYQYSKYCPVPTLDIF